MEFKIKEIGVDALNNTTVNGFYVDELGAEFGKEVVFSFKPDEVPESEEDFKALITKCAEDKQPLKTELDTERETVQAKLVSFSLKDVKVSVAPPVEEGTGTETPTEESTLTRNRTDR